jgi:hypothetical protein
MSANRSTHFLLIRIEYRFEMDTMALESARTHESRTHVAHADKDSGALSLLVNVSLESGKDFGNRVADMRFSNDTKAGHILSDQGAIDVEFTSARI